jgi:hypothetical protein
MVWITKAMTPSKAQILTMRRNLLVLEASIQRLQLRRDIQALRQASDPRSLLVAWRRRQGRVVGDVVSTIEAVVLPLLRASAARSPRVQVLAAFVLAWRLVRTWRERRP